MNIALKLALGNIDSGLVREESKAMSVVLEMIRSYIERERNNS